VLGLVAGAVGPVERVTTPPQGLRAEMLEFPSETHTADDSKAKRELGTDHQPSKKGCASASSGSTSS
jgi:hypothetical protein